MSRSASDSSVSSAPAQRPPRPSATLVVVRDPPAGVEVLLLKRSESGDHNSGAWRRWCTDTWRDR